MTNFFSLKFDIFTVLKVTIISLSSIIVLFSIFSFLIFIVFPDKIMDGASPDYSKEGEVLEIAADQIKIMSDNQEYTFTLNPAGNSVQMIFNGKTEFVSIYNIKKGDNIRIEGWNNRNKIEVGTIYLYKQ